MVCGNVQKVAQAWQKGSRDEQGTADPASVREGNRGGSSDRLRGRNAETLFECAEMELQKSNLTLS